jgi:para-nitrobenzyl esterase
MPRKFWTSLLTLLALGANVPGQALDSTPRVRVRSGVLIGTANGGVEVFKGIPYAAPPVGPLRGALPQPAIAWSGERAANDFGHSCMQSAPPHNVPPDSPAAQLSEDCLTLNVWAPQSAQEAPVMVWIHGGGNSSGSSADIYYDGSAFARDGIVLVSVNYRLGAAGFQPHAGEANFGLWDQVAALKWVRDNIAAFGGDPGNVTLFGESAGGQDTLALMTAAPARDLFQKAIVESGGGGWRLSPPLSEAQADRDGDWGPVVDGHLLKESPLSAFAAGRFARIPLIIGTNNEEGSLLGPEASTEGLFPRLSKEDLAKLATIYGPRASSDSALARLVFRDGYFASKAQWIASRMSAAGSPAYVYRFEYVMSPLQRRRTGAHHASEIPFVFDRLPTILVDEADNRVARALHSCWVAFARTGKPQCTEAGDWPNFGSSGEWMVFDAHPSARPVEGAAALELLQCRLSEGLHACGEAKAGLSAARSRAPQ